MSSKEPLHLPKTGGPERLSLESKAKLQKMIRYTGMGICCWMVGFHLKWYHNAVKPAAAGQAAQQAAEQQLRASSWRSRGRRKRFQGQPVPALSRKLAKWLAPAAEGRPPVWHQVGVLSPPPGHGVVGHGPRPALAS